MQYESMHLEYFAIADESVVAVEITNRFEAFLDRSLTVC